MGGKPKPYMDANLACLSSMTCEPVLFYFNHFIHSLGENVVLATSQRWWCYYTVSKPKESKNPESN